MDALTEGDASINVLANLPILCQKGEDWVYIRDEPRWIADDNDLNKDKHIKVDNSFVFVDYLNPGQQGSMTFYSNTAEADSYELLPKPQVRFDYWIYDDMGDSHSAKAH